MQIHSAPAAWPGPICTAQPNAKTPKIACRGHPCRCMLQVPAWAELGEQGAHLVDGGDEDGCHSNAHADRVGVQVAPRHSGHPHAQAQYCHGRKFRLGRHLARPKAFRVQL